MPFEEATKVVYIFKSQRGGDILDQSIGVVEQAAGEKKLAPNNDLSY